MRIAELSRRADVPVPTIKYYLREGLLFPGERTSHNQAQYTEAHVRRLRLVRALIEVGGLSVAATREVLAKMYGPGMSVLDSAGKAQFAMVTPRPVIEDEAWEAATRHTDELIERLGWRVRATNPARQTLASALATLFRLGQTDQLKLLDGYARAARQAAEADLAQLRQERDPDTLLETAVIWTALGDVVFSALRRFAQENASYGAAAEEPAPSSARDTSEKPAAPSDPGVVENRTSP
ncbi:MerR family transcriptional regulator [Sphaerisporangium krabiense]|uniref:DNA-binding transcriptional MerR regulator n=1 Tax=Sphaerisporangium krabiense TaxID=763782 RepID=A0A7W9DT25_9ACTN|nr:MerR family transcriptional regulator [Sphaerisporangium krabiense]MBB5628975.1 DNA-binding transcriptional MerR regulator [Sphaerisporangium krabiense]GII60185.1 MerR family transcriptional regulator [Sphaerisporangium krabiense]